MRVKTEQLPIGSQLSHPIRGDGNRLLLDAGMTLTARIKARLIKRGINEVLIHADDAAILPRTRNSASPPAQATQPKRPKQPVPRPKSSQQPSLRDTVAQIKAQAATLAASVSRHISILGPPLSERQISRGAVPYNSRQRERLAQTFSITTQLLGRIAAQAKAGDIKDARLLTMTTKKFIAELTDDTDNVLASSNELATSPTFTDRGVRLALLGMAMAIDLDWDEANVREVGLCGLIHDFGMLRLDENLSDPQAKISAQDLKKLREHPLHTLDILSSMKNVSLAVRLAATQVHENPDGSGYPRGLTREEIHPYATLLHAADAYITLTTPVHGRQAYLSYDVMVYLINQVKADRMDDKAMRALLQVVSLFPIGSHVRLSDGTEAQVIRRNAQNYTAPIVQRVDADRMAHLGSAHTSIIDLAQNRVRVVAPVVPPNRNETRLEKSLMGQVLWEGGVG